MKNLPRPILIISCIFVVILTVGGIYFAKNYTITEKKEAKEALEDVKKIKKDNDGKEKGGNNSTSSKGIVTYFPAWNVNSSSGKKFEVKDIPWDKVTQINHAFFDVTEKGEIASTDSWSDFENTAICPVGKADWTKYPKTGYEDGTVFGHFGAYKYYKEKYPKVKVVIALGGWTRSNNFHDVAKDSEKRKALVKNMVDFMNKYQFVDGFDIDWEYPGFSRESSDQYDRGAKGGPEDKANFTLLLKDIREAFDSNNMKDKILSVAVSADPKKMANTEPDKYSKYVNYIGVMSYDFGGAWDKTTGHLAAIYKTNDDKIPERGALSMEATLSLLKDTYKVPAEKIYGGSPFYSRGWSDVSEGPNGDGLFQAGGGSYTGSIGPGGQFKWYEVKNFENDKAWKKFKDPKTKTPYLYNKDTKNFLTYEDEDSLKERISLINKNNYGGLIIWDVSGDDLNGYPMHSLIFNGFAGKLVTKTSDNKKDDSVKPKEEISELAKEPKKEGNKNSNLKVTEGEWVASKAYKVGDVVSYNGVIYKCLQAHTSQEDWAPENAPALWEK